MRGLRLTKRGELVRDTALALIAALTLYAAVIAAVAGLEGMGL